MLNVILPSIVVLLLLLLLLLGKEFKFDSQNNIILSVTLKPVILSVIILNAVLLSVMVPL